MHLGIRLWRRPRRRVECHYTCWPESWTSAPDHWDSRSPDSRYWMWLGSWGMWPGCPLPRSHTPAGCRRAARQDRSPRRSSGCSGTCPVLDFSSRAAGWSCAGLTSVRELQQKKNSFDKFAYYLIIPHVSSMFNDIVGPALNQHGVKVSCNQPQLL